MDVVVVASDVFDAVELQLVDILFSREEAVGDLVVNVLLCGLYVDNGAKLVFVEQLVVLGFTTSHDDESFGHSKEGIHGGRVAVELVEDDVAGVHHLLVLGERHVLCALDAHAIGTEVMLKAEKCREHEVGAFVSGTGTLDANEEVECGEWSV